MNETYGIIDIGSNTIRLVIYKYEMIGRFREIENIKVVARLRNYLEKNSVLNKKGINILLETLKLFEEITTHHRVDNVKGIATATIRSASNQEEILGQIKAHTKLDVRVLSEYEEAYYGFLAVVNSTSIKEGITIDIGGGSTEVTYFKNREIKNFHSFPFGALSLKADFIKTEVPTPLELASLSDYLYQQIHKLPWIKDKHVPLIGIGGSARNMAQVDQGLKSYPIAGLHQYEMSNQDILRVSHYLCNLPYNELQKVDGLSEDRADIIIPAIEVFKTTFSLANASSFVLSRKGLRDGVFYKQLMEPNEITTFPNVLEESMYEIINEYKIDMDNVIQVLKITRQLYEHFNISTIDLSEEYNGIKQAVAMFYLGGYIDSEASSQHTFYVIANRTIDGLTHSERIKLALIASYKSKSTFKQYIEPFKDWYGKEETKNIRFLGALIKIAYGLNYTKRNIVESIAVDKNSKEIKINVYCSKNWKAEQYQVEKHKKHLEKVIKRDLLFNFIQI